MVEKKILDVKKVRLLIEADGRNLSQFSKDLGLGRSFMSNILNGCNTSTKKYKAGEIKECYLRLLCTELNVTEDDILLKEPEIINDNLPPVSDANSIDLTPVIDAISNVNSVDITPILDKISELIVTINKLGNIEMQNMAYLKEIRDSSKVK